MGWCFTSRLPLVSLWLPWVGPKTLPAYWLVGLVRSLNYNRNSQTEEKASSSGLFSVELSSVGAGDEGQC